MAKNRSDEATTQAAEAAAPANTSAVVADDRFRMVTSPFTGERMARKDFIKDCWQNRYMSRGDIAKKLTEMNTVENGGNGKKVPYQVVFAVLKKGAEEYGGPSKNPNKPAEATSTEGAAA